MAYQCYYRFDQAYVSHFASNNNNNVFSNNNSTTPKNQALIAITDSILDPNWYPDSGASCHLTPDVANLISQNNYVGSNIEYVDDGTRFDC